MAVCPNYDLIALSGTSASVDIFKKNYNTSVYDSLQQIVQLSVQISDLDFTDNCTTLLITSSDLGV